MLIKKNQRDAEMIYSFIPNKAKNETVWTKVYFIIIFACLYDTQAIDTTTNGTYINPTKYILIYYKLMLLIPNIRISKSITWKWSVPSA